MNNGQAIFAQLMDQLPWYEFQKCVARYQGDAHREMALASLLGGLALANAGLGVVHGLAAPLRGLWNSPHGALCAALLTHSMAANIAALRVRAAHLGNCVSRSARRG